MKQNGLEKKINVFQSIEVFVNVSTKQVRNIYIIYIHINQFLGLY